MKRSQRRVWERALKRPRQLLLRKVMFQIHLWVGIVVALYIIAIGLSGSILVFKDELMPRPRYAGINFDARQCTPERIIASMHAAAATHRDLIPSLATCPTEANLLYAITLRPPETSRVASHPQTIYVHPQTGIPLGQIEGAVTWVSYVERFHFNLLLQRSGRIWNGIGAAVLLLLVVSGLILWWPGLGKWQRAFKVNPKLSWRRINFDLHSAAGIWTVLFVLTWAVTGIYFAWEAPFERVISSISPIVTARYPKEDLDQITKQMRDTRGHTMVLAKVLSDAEAASPETALEGFFFGTGPRAMLTVYMAHGHLGDYTRTDFLYFDQQTGELLYTWHRGQNKSLGDWLLWLLVPLHFGTSWGFAGKIIWASVGLVLPLLVVTGFLIYWNRTLRKSLNRRRTRIA